ncbi:MAG: hypothetical protein M1830_000015 [Pleopsidium flavum]|nr:MAG: hypothetical protein M1830_000015 [Pleopsidium flavum]
MNDFRNLQHYIAQIKASPSPDEYYEEGYAILLQCTAEAQAVLSAHYDSGSLQVPTNNGEREKVQLQRYVATGLLMTVRLTETFRSIVLDASARRFQAQKILLRATAAIRWVNSRNGVLQGQKPHATHGPALHAANNNLRAELSTITDERVVNDLHSADYQAGHWLQEDPPLNIMLSWICSAR